MAKRESSRKRAPVAAAEAHYVEDWGVLFEQSGMPRMTGRVLGWLLICDPPHQTAAELAEALQASKGSISTTTALLERVGIIERFGLPGERSSYFRVQPDAFTRTVRHKLAAIAAWRDLAERGLKLLQQKRAGRATTKRLRDIHGLYAFMEREYPALIERWERERADE